ncbi:MAG TPA: hypothetical protein VF950_06435 [Planctomycetota bacterium]
MPVPHPTSFSRPPAEMAKSFLRATIDRGPDPFWHYRVAVPVTSKLRPSVGLDVPSPVASLGLFYREDVEADLEILGVRLTREIDPLFWLEEALKVHGIQPESWKALPTAGGLLGDAAAAWEVDGRAFAGRFLTLKYGSRLFVIVCRAPRDVYERIAEEVFLSVTQFEVVQKPDGPCAEPLAELKGAPWTLSLPTSWAVTPGPSGFQAKLRPPDDAAFASAWRPFPGVEGLKVPPPPPPASYGGDLSVSFFPPNAYADPRPLQELCVETLTKAGLAPSTPAFAPGPKFPSFPETWDLASAATPGVEVRGRVARGPKGWMLAALASPARASNPFAWMQNRRTLDLTAASLEFLTP